MNAVIHINSIFENLATRLSSENNLSDFFWAAMETVPDLKVAFCRHFNFEPTTDEPIEITREETILTGRPDFIVRSGSRRLIVEVKLGDRNYHFKQYISAFPGETVAFGLLTNHRLHRCDFHEGSNSGWTIREWDSFLNHISKFEYGEYQTIVDAFLNYAKKVCGVITMDDMRFDIKSLYSLYIFTNLAKKVVPIDQPEFSCSVYNRQDRALGDSWTGIIYVLELKSNDKKKFWPYFGLVFETPEEVRLCVALSYDWNKEIVQKIRTIKTGVEGLEIADYPKGGGVNLFMPQIEFKRFNALGIDDQKEMLDDFYLRVNNFIWRCSKQD